MDADHANPDRGRMKISELWRPLPWWERVVYLLAALLFLLGFLPDGVLTGRGDAILNLRVPEIESLLLTASFPFVVATCVFAMQRWRPDDWRDFRRLSSMRAVLVGASVLFAFGFCDSVIELATPADRIRPNLPFVPRGAVHCRRRPRPRRHVARGS
jgi:hypothetical protein